MRSKGRVGRGGARSDDDVRVPNNCCLLAAIVFLVSDGEKQALLPKILTNGSNHIQNTFILTTFLLQFASLSQYLHKFSQCAAIHRRIYQE